MKLVTGIFSCLLIVSATSVLNNSFAFAEEGDVIIEGGTISSEPFDPEQVDN